MNNVEKYNDGDFAEAFAKAVRYMVKGYQVTEGVITGDVDETAFTCTVKCGNSTFTAVPLAVLINSQASIIQIPAVNSNCLLIFRDGSIQRPQILSIDTCTKFLIKIGGSLLQVDDTTFTFNDGNNGGMVLVNDLVNRMNLIENAFNSHTHILTLSSGTGTAAPTASPLTPTVATDIESTVILQ